MTDRGKRKVVSGVVVSDKMTKTAVVFVERTYRHAKYGKVVKSAKKYYAHDGSANPSKVGDVVTIEECRPMSKLKRWRVIESASAK
ncbi:MAG: 30S ribosomal protein S17 [Chlamydiae bacterium]|nr:30S ribosomal protein S17 [Chlamydiota bacterium]